MISTKRLVLFHVLPTLSLTDSANKSKHAKKNCWCNHAILVSFNIFFFQDQLGQQIDNLTKLEDQLKSTYAFFLAEIRGS